MTERSLTRERQLAFLKRAKNTALGQIKSGECVTDTVVKLDKAGEPVLDTDGQPVLVDKRVLKKTYVGKEWDERIARFESTGQYL